MVNISREDYAKILERQSRKPLKHHNIITEVDGIKFRSKKEAARYDILKVLNLSGKIKGLELQPRFKFPCGTTFIADFRYFDESGEVIEDTKGFKTDVFKLKFKMFKQHYPDKTLRII